MAYIKKLKDNELIGGTDNTDVYPVTSTEAVYNRENVSQEYINNHVDGSKIVDGTVTTSKIADNTVTMGKLGNEVQTEIQRSTQNAWNPRGVYNGNTIYQVNDLVYLSDTNSSYLSLKANNQGHNPAWQSAEDRWWMMVVSGLDMKEIAEHPTYVGEDNYVYNYDFETHSYIKTDIYVKGDTGDIIYPILEIDENGHIIVSYSPTPPEQQNDSDIDENDDVNIEGGE